MSIRPRPHPRLARAGDVFTVPVTLSATTPYAVVDSSNTAGAKIADHVYRQNLRTGGVSGTIPTGTQLVVFGCGPQNGLIPNSMVEAPTYSNANAQYVYNRLLVVYELTASKVTLKAVLGADGDLMDDMSVNMQTFNN